MKTIFSIILCAFTVIAWAQPETSDESIFEEVMTVLGAPSDKTTAKLVADAAYFFLETPYVGQTLEKEPEHLVINLREMDCTTFAENCLALARTAKKKKASYQQFQKELTNIRYRNGKINRYPSRLHYFSDWLFENQEKQLIQLKSEIAKTPYKLEVGFMSSHPDSYRQLKANEDFVQALSEKEKEINEREMFYIPKEKIATYESQLNEGDIVGLTTNIDGLDISHVGILVKKEDRIYLLHASLSAKKVVVTDEPLHEYLSDSKRISGIMLARPL